MKGGIVRKVFWLCFFVLLFMGVDHYTYAHEGHHSEGYPATIQTSFSMDFVAGDLIGWIAKIGRLHLLILHFPIALIVMTILAELLSIWFRNPLFDHAARFMILAAACFVIPTVLFGWALSYGQTYEGFSLELFQWHRFFGMITAGLTLFAAIWRECLVRSYTTKQTPYYVSLILLFFCVNLTGTFGGILAFGF